MEIRSGSNHLQRGCRNDRDRSFRIEALEGSRIAIFGLGRSGLSVAKAASERGNPVTLLDELPEDRIVKQEMLKEVSALEGVTLRLGWDGRYEEKPDLLVVNPAVRKEHPRLLEAVEKGIEVIGEIEFAYRISKAPIVGITGTNGKSTTTVMTYLCLQSMAANPVLCGNIYGSGYAEMPLTDAAAASAADQVLVAEVSSYQLEWIRHFKPKSAGITNIWPDHLERHATFQEYVATKQKIFMNMGPEDVAVVRANDPVVAPPGARTSAYVPRGRRRPGDQNADVQRGPVVWTFGATGQDATVEERDLKIKGVSVPLEKLPFTEPHNYQNACMACLLALGAVHETRSDTLESILQAIEGLKKFRGLEHRMELVGEKREVRVINNSMCTNPDAVIKSVAAVRDRTHILMGGLNKKLDFAPLRHYLANQRHVVYLFGTDAQALDEMLGGGHDLFPSMEDAFNAAAKNAKDREVIMLAPGCASTDAFIDFRDRGNVFKSIAKDWLRT